MSDYSTAIQDAAQRINKSSGMRPQIAIVLGTGLDNLWAAISTQASQQSIFEYHDIACLPSVSAPGHAGQLGLFELRGTTVAVCRGRAHLYEGYCAREVAAIVYLLNCLGAQQLFITNAAGALNPNYAPGEVMLLHDHINFTGHNPLRGQDESFGSRFPDMSQPYDQQLSNAALKAGENASLKVHLGVYAGVLGPSLETSAERRMLRTLGADAVGMSTVLEVIAARHCGLRVLGLSAISNLALGDAKQQPDSIEQVLHHAAIAGVGIKKIIFALLNSASNAEESQ